MENEGCHFNPCFSNVSYVSNSVMSYLSLHKILPSASAYLYAWRAVTHSRSQISHLTATHLKVGKKPWRSGV